MTRPRSRPGGYDPDETRRLLLAAATRLIHRHGYHATSVESIVTEAGVTKGAFYYHFAGKQEVLHQIQHDYIDARLTSCRDIMARSDSPREQLRLLVREVLLGVDRYREEVDIFMQERRFLTGRDFAAIREKRDQVAECYMSVLRKGVDAGELDPHLDPRIVTFSILGMGAWASTWFSREGRLSGEEVAEHLADLVLAGLVTRRND